ncbi:hypothetical protein RHSIM_Rhsim03G0227000 [Rhododendron simsii]|uniref:DUF1677 family protein n=1 Tax=Rhododendron simsii TaxID=118357 RepID=A0A834H8N1_RHOSS|nr:hypothetical protein RHSIM_Rhsim03G0227000 [Rhododendron simsii]
MQEVESFNSETQLHFVQVEMARCESCGLTEECTLAYISRIRERYNGRWICGLCIEAVKYEVLRSQMLITTEEALNRHVDFCRKFRSLSGETEDPISAIGRILRRSLHSPRSMPNSPMRESRRMPLIRCESCFPSISR